MANKSEGAQVGDTSFVQAMVGAHNGFLVIGAKERLSQNPDDQFTGQMGLLTS